jgi:UDP-glucose 4-epimerase
MENHKCNVVVFSSSACTYGENPSCVETDPRKPTNPYGRTKVMTEEMLEDVCFANKDFVAIVLRYFNPIGAHPSGLIGEDPLDVPSNLIPYINRVVVGKLPHLNVLGHDYPTVDGTGVRDYVHVMDIAAGHISALRKALNGFNIFNLGTGKGCSVLEVIAAYEKACGAKIPYELCPRRPGDAATSCAIVEKANKDLDWKAEFNLDDMCRDSYNWIKLNPEGYK